MGNNNKYIQKIIKNGIDNNEKMWDLPIWSEYIDMTKSKIADLKNIGGPNGGMISAGKFLETFVSAPYVHMDVAGPTWLDAKENYKGISGTGYGVRLLYTFLKNY
jgi:leucyl aminopeptidase